MCLRVPTPFPCTFCAIYLIPVFSEHPVCSCKWFCGCKCVLAFSHPVQMYVSEREHVQMFLFVHTHMYCLCVCACVYVCSTSPCSVLCWQVDVMACHLHRHPVSNAG